MWGLVPDASARMGCIGMHPIGRICVLLLQRQGRRGRTITHILGGPVLRTIRVRDYIRERGIQISRAHMSGNAVCDTILKKNLWRRRLV